MRNGDCKAMPKPLTAKAFDDITRAPYQGHRSKIIWTAEAIGAKIGRSGAFVRRTLVSLEGSPVKQIGHTYCAHEDELMDFFRATSKKSHFGSL